MTDMPTLIDPFARAITYLRVSVTDRCDFRCVYCMSENMPFLPKAELLSLEELDRLCSRFVELGIRKLRITGGEPLVRKGIMTYFEALSRHLASGRLDELTLTSNGSQLRRFAKPLADCGAKRINVSRDTLDEQKFKDITRWGRFAQVMDGIDEAQAAGIRIKINAVALKGTNDDEAYKMGDWGGQRGFDLTFIEVMPMGEDMGDGLRLDQFWDLNDVRAHLARNWTLTDIPLNTGGPARYVRIEETGQKVGFITPLSHNFCESCNRVRLTCTGQLFMCLGQEDEADLRRVLREGTPEALDRAIHAAIARKPKGHDFDYSRQNVGGTMTRHMSHTGG